MENLYNFTQSQLLQEWLKTDSYRNLLASLDVIAVGLEGFEILIQLKAAYPYLRVGYMYYESMDSFPDAHGKLIRENFTFIPLGVSVKYRKGDWYMVSAIDKNIVHDTLAYLAYRVTIIGAMTDPILLRLMEYYEFTQRNLLLRRPLYYETSTLRGAINKSLKFSNLPAHIQVIDTIKIHRYLNKLRGKTTMLEVHEEVISHWFGHLLQILKLPNIERWDFQRVRLDAGLF